MAATEAVDIGRSLVDFSMHGIFPEENVSSQHIDPTNLAPALKALAEAKKKLESEIHTINEETASDVNTWVANAKSIEDDINRSRSLANEIVRRSEAPDVSGKTIQEAEEKVQFLKRETSYNHQVLGALQGIKHVSQLLDQAEQARDDRRILDSLHLLQQTWAALDEIRVSKSVRAMKLLDMRAFELKSAAHEVLNHVWSSLVQVDVEHGRIAIYENREDEPMSLLEVVTGLKAYKEVDQRMALLWHDIDQALIGPRTDKSKSHLPGISTDNSVLSLAGKTDHKIASLFADLEQIMGYFSKRLPEELVQKLSNVMMPDLISRITSTWLDEAVPASLKEIGDFQEVIGAVKLFCHSLKGMHYTGFDELQEWVDGAPRVWLSKCRENALGSIRTKLGQGLGKSKQVERVETQAVSKSEGKELAAAGTGAVADNDGWDAAWDDGEDDTTNTSKPAADVTMSGTNEDDGADAWGWGEDDGAEDKAEPTIEPPAAEPKPEAEDDPTEAWGWGDEDTTEPATHEAEPVAPTRSHGEETREMTLKETYNISSMPEPVLALISSILEDGAFLVAAENNPVASAAAGLYSLPTLILAMFRAVSPHFYALDAGGKMYLYNDATYLCERLTDLVAQWKARQDLVPRAIAMLRLDNDIKTLHAFAARAYASEMTTQRTILRDLMGGAQNMLQQDGLDSSDLISQIDSATARVRVMAATWQDILARSAWHQAVGSLVDTIANKVISDVMDLSAIGQDEAYNIANMIVKVTELDDLFLPPGETGDTAIPVTAEYAGSWLRLKFLSEVLQSNLNEVRYLWFESDLSLYFTPEEVVELIGLSFVDNARTREVVKEIQARTEPRA